MVWRGKILVSIRPATIKDLDQITDIYNEAILKTVATFDTEIKTPIEQKKWFNQHGDKYPILVAEENGCIVGWVALSKYSTRCAYSETVEISLYVLEKYQRKGIGKNLMKEIIKAGEQAGLHVLLARITDGNKISIHLHESFGFEHVGILKEVGSKFGRLLDVYLMQKII
jgi:phosphinothricin acetyltransferase